MQEERRHDEQNFIGENEEVPYDMTTAGDEDTTVWDNLVQAFKPDLLRLDRHHSAKNASSNQ